MATRPKKEKAKPDPKKFPRTAVPVYTTAACTEVEHWRDTAKVVTSPELAAYRVVKGAESKSGLGDWIDVPTLMAQLRTDAKAANENDLSQPIAMLMNQATALQSLFARLSERGMSFDTAIGFELNMRMALRAQSQCRATLETLAAIKNPPIVYARQANVTTGPQQINNGTAAPSRTQETEIEQSKLSGSDNELCPNGGTPALASGANPQLETVGKIDRAEVKSG